MAESAPRSALSRARRPLLGLLFVIAATELGAAAVWWGTQGAPFSYAEMTERRRALGGEGLPAGPEAPFMNHEILHPYAGYLHDPDRYEGGDTHAWPHGGGLFDTADEDFVVLVVGGSVAGQITGHLEEAMVEAGLPRPILVGTAEGGYKQPQQLAIVSYLLSVGARFDVLINVDGFNEAVLPVTDNMRFGVSPHYPRSWHERFADARDRPSLRLIGAIVQRQERRAEVARWLSGSWLRFSVTANVVWSSWDRGLEAELAATRERLRSRRGGRTYRTHGPRPPEREDDTLRSAADVWARSSILLDQLARANGFVYLHVLQPNQYLPGTKPFTDEERRLHIRRGSTYGAVAAQGYDALFAAAPRLVEAGVDFHDLTRVFEGDPRTLYEDDCCHVNELGRRALADRVAQLLAARLERQRAADAP